MLNGTLKFEAVQVEELPPFLQTLRVFGDVFALDATSSGDPRAAPLFFLAAAQPLAESEERADYLPVRPDFPSYNLKRKLRKLTKEVEIMFTSKMIKLSLFERLINGDD